MVREEIARYAVEAAGTRDDLDEGLEAAALETWEPAQAPSKRAGRRR